MRVAARLLNRKDDSAQKRLDIACLVHLSFSPQPLSLTISTIHRIPTLLISVRAALMPVLPRLLQHLASAIALDQHL